MTSSSKAREIRRPFYGWYIVGVAFISLFIGAGTGGFTFGIFLPAMSAELGWSQSSIVAAASISTITAALLGPVLGRVVDQRGPRLVLVLSLILMGVGLLGAALVDQPWHLYVTFGLITGAARSALQSVVPGSMIANWFVRRRSAAYGIAAMGPPCSNVLLPIFLAAVVGAMGWRAGWIGMALLGLILGLPPALLIARRRPEDLGLRPDGDLPEPAAATSTGRTVSDSATASRDWTVREAIHSPAFWMVAAGMALILIAPNVSIIFLFSYLSSQGIAPAAAAAAVSAASAMQMVSRLGFWTPITTKVGSVRWLLVIWGGLLVCSSLLLAFAQGEIWAYIAAGVLGLAMGGNLVLHLQIWPEYFGRIAAGTIIGLGSLLQGMTSAIVPLLLAALLDRTGSYTLLYLIVAGCVLAGVVLHVIVGRPHRPIRE